METWDAKRAERAFAADRTPVTDLEQRLQQARGDAEAHVWGVPAEVGFISLSAREALAHRKAQEKLLAARDGEGFAHYRWSSAPNVFEGGVVEIGERVVGDAEPVCRAFAQAHQTGKVANPDQRWTLTIHWHPERDEEHYSASLTHVDE